MTKKWAFSEHANPKIGYVPVGITNVSAKCMRQLR